MTGSDLESIVYVSSAVKLLSLDEIQNLLARARERNGRYGVTGVLLYIGGNFMQYIEGPADGLDIIYRLIQAHELHSGIIEVSRESISERQFDGWSMAFQSREFEGYVGQPGERNLIDLIREMPADNPGAARIVLRSFWESGGS